MVSKEQTSIELYNLKSHLQCLKLCLNTQHPSQTPKKCLLFVDWFLMTPKERTEGGRKTKAERPKYMTRCLWSFLVAQGVKNPSANAEDVNPIPGLGTGLEKEMATCSSLLAWKIPRTEEPGGLQSMGSQKSQTWLTD